MKTRYKLRDSITIHENCLSVAMQEWGDEIRKIGKRKNPKRRAILAQLSVPACGPYFDLRARFLTHDQANKLVAFCKKHKIT